MGEIPNLVNKLTDAYVNPTAANNSIDTGTVRSTVKTVEKLILF